MYLPKQVDAWEVGETVFEVKRVNDDRLRIEVTEDGYVFADSWSAYEGEEPTRADIEHAWKRNRRAFRPYDQSTGCYV